MNLGRAPRFAGFVLAVLIVAGHPSIAEAQQKKVQLRNQYTVPSDQEHWIDRDCANFNT